MAKNGTSDSGKGQSGGSSGSGKGTDDPIGHDVGDDKGIDDPATHDVSDDHGLHDPLTHDVGDDHGIDDPATHDVGDDHGVDDPATHDIGDDHGVHDPLTHDVGDDHGIDDPTTHDVGDDHGVDDPATHDIGDDHGVHDPLTHDVGDDHGGDRLKLVLNERSGQWIFTDDEAEHDRWMDDHGRGGGEIELRTPRAGDDTVAVWRFHDPVSDVYFWTTNTALKDDLLLTQPNLAFDGEAFRAYADDRSGGQQAVGVVWDQGAGPYGNFIYAAADEAVKLAGLSDSDDLIYLGEAFWI
jgi:hypothetical protein